MKFITQRYVIPDEPMKPFIDKDEIMLILNQAVSSPDAVRGIIARSLSKQRLSMQEVAVLINTKDAELITEIKEAAKKLKEMVYGNRIVLFAPLYVGNLCVNDCTYCGFKISNKAAERKTLSMEELLENVNILEKEGQKRLILVFGEHKTYSPQFIAEAVKKVYSCKEGNGSIRRVNINAAPLDVEGFRIVKESGIGTYQVFQETYNPDAYKIYHQRGPKADFNYRLTALDRAQEAGLDDVGIGALFGLYDWRFEVMGLIRHTNHLEACYNVGPHTISFPRLQYASEVNIDQKYLVNDDDFTKMVAIIRLAVPYTGMILTAREPEHIRDIALEFGCSQIDAGTKIELGAYARSENGQQSLEKEQFMINDTRSLNQVINDLVGKGYIPSFCTACYRLGRTGEHFMEFSVPGFIKRFCQPNAILTLAEYLVDYADKETAEKGWALIEDTLKTMNDGVLSIDVVKKLDRIRNGERDIYY